MYDHQEILTDFQPEIMRLYDFAERSFVSCTPPNNCYLSFCHPTQKISFDFRKSFENGLIVGFRHVKVSVSPHYHKNQYKHNADILTLIQAINSLQEIFDYIGITAGNYNNYRVVVSEFGFNISLPSATEKVLNLVSFHQRTPFRTERTATKYYKISQTDRTKEWKLYDKGIQFPELNQDILRIEVRLKKAGNITKKTGIRNIGDLLKTETFSRYFEFFVNDFDNIFFCGDADYFLKLKTKINENDNRNLWGKEKEKYLKNRPHLRQLKTKIKGQLIDIFNSAISPQRTPINKGKFDFEKDHASKVNGETAPFKVCEITKLDISMQKKTSKFLCNAGLRFYFENQPDTYQRLTKEFLTDDKRNADLQTQFYYLSHNIRNAKTNEHHNRKKFEERNYHPNQLQLNFS